MLELLTAISLKIIAIVIAWGLAISLTINFIPSIQKDMKKLTQLSAPTDKDKKFIEVTQKENK